MIHNQRRASGMMLIVAIAVMTLLYFVAPDRDAGFTVRGGIASGGDAGTSLEASRGFDRRDTGADLAVFVGNLVMIPESGSAVVFLVTDDQERYLPITIGQFEALAINRFMQSVAPPRPMTHELLLDAVRNLGGQIVSITVDSLEQGTFTALIRIGLEDGSETIIDARPSDSIALAVKAGAAIYVDPVVMDQAGRTIGEYEDEEETGPRPDVPEATPFFRKPDAETIL